MKKILLIISIIFILFSCSDDNLNNKEITLDENNSYKILALWDSLTAWYNLEYEDSYPIQLQSILEEKWFSYEVINAWVSWDTSKNLLSRINLYNEDYDIVLLNIWWNDWLRSLSTEDLKENILTIVDNFSDSKIVLFSIDLPFNYPSLYRNKLKKVYEGVSKQRDIYYYWLFFEWLNYNDHFLGDGLHPNKEWYRIIAENISEYLLKNNIIKND